MKKSLKAIVLAVVLTIACATPVFATEPTIAAETAMLTNKMNGFAGDVSTLVQFDNNCGAADVASINAIVSAVAADVTKSNLAEEENYIKYLEAKVGNALETERVKQQNVVAMKEVCKVNPSFQAQVNAAVAEYNKAVADRQAAVQAVADAKAHFAALNKSFHDAAMAKAAGDAQAKVK